MSTAAPTKLKAPPVSCEHASVTTRPATMRLMFSPCSAPPCPLAMPATVRPISRILEAPDDVASSTKMPPPAAAVDGLSSPPQVRSPCRRRRSTWLPSAVRVCCMRRRRASEAPPWMIVLATTTSVSELDTKKAPPEPCATLLMNSQPMTVRLAVCANTPPPLPPCSARLLVNTDDERVSFAPAHTRAPPPPTSPNPSVTPTATLPVNVDSKMSTSLSTAMPPPPDAELSLTSQNSIFTSLSSVPTRSSRGAAQWSPPPVLTASLPSMSQRRTVPPPTSEKYTPPP
mmetsp:Transcript_15932/g.55481  ORF Transcript_15932/g.55481 Transcript_15932/m.55481 type:complete len:286 (-) Transcript_15932:12925-13782(-)